MVRGPSYRITEWSIASKAEWHKEIEGKDRFDYSRVVLKSRANRSCVNCSAVFWWSQVIFHQDHAGQGWKNLWSASILRAEALAFSGCKRNQPAINFVASEENGTLSAGGRAVCLWWRGGRFPSRSCYYSGCWGLAMSELSVSRWRLRYHAQALSFISPDCCNGGSSSDKSSRILRTGVEQK